MSLLIKALEQAAKDRDSAKAGTTPAAAPASRAGTAEPTLEPLPPPRATPAPGSAAIGSAAHTGPALDPASQPRAGLPPGRGAPPALDPDPITPQRGVSPLDAPSARPNALSLDASGAARKTAQTSASMANIDAQHQRARAATVMQASGGRGSAMIAYLRASPVALLGAIGVLFGLGFGVYVYLQISQPGIFVRQAATRAPDGLPPAPPAVSPAPAQPDLASAPNATANAPLQGVTGTTAQDPLTATNPAANPGIATQGAAAIGPSSSGAVGAAPTPERAPGPASASFASSASSTSSTGASPTVSSAAVIGSPRAAEPFRDPGIERAANLPRERGMIRPAGPADAPKPQVTPPAVPPAALALDATPAARERIAVTPAAAQPRLNPALSQAYAALQSGNLDEARALYTRLNQSEPLNVDALLGLAYIASQENRTEDAVARYMRILSVNPRHAAAQGALIGLMGRADPVASETRLKQLLSREPSAFLHFVLGNLYADQGLWSQAQQAYFQAHNLEPDNPDYAYNLAVGLDHLRQRKLALNFYRRAEQLATSLGRSNFNLSHARERVSALSSQLE